MNAQRHLRMPSIASVLVLAIGCSAFDETLISQSSELRSSCSLRRPPLRVSSKDDDKDVGEVIYALNNILVDQTPNEAWRRIGYDLDGLCSEGASPPVECMPPGLNAAPEFDGDGGTDNVFGHVVLAFFKVARPDIQELLAGFQQNGTGVMLLRIRGWNGLPDDGHVEVAMSMSEYGTPGLADGSPPSPAAPGGVVYHADGSADPPVPRWDGNDYWWARADHYVNADPELPRLHDDNAYVADNTLVMQVPLRYPIIFGGLGTAAVYRLSDGKLTAKISSDTMRVEQAILSGRWPVIDFLEAIEQTGYCKGTANYERMVRITELASDVRATPGTGGDGIDCDAMSVGLSMTGVRAHWGGLSNNYGMPNPCDTPGVADPWAERYPL